MQNFDARLLDWFDEHGRKDLPWQRDLGPYRVWVSEIMLQQTQVKSVIPYFERFMAKFPDVAALASADVDEVLHQWTGLGYYARARNLHRAANIVMQQHDGELPLDLAALTDLPGIGRSTAGAIIAICTGAKMPILDGNVKRILTRCFAMDGWPGQTATERRLWELAEALMPTERVADYTQAIMDLGATRCTPRNPLCHECPVACMCVAHRESRTHEFPNKRQRASLPVRTTAMLIVRHGSEVLLARRPASGVWGGLWSFPELTAEESQAADEFLQANDLRETRRTTLPAFRHTFTHFHLDVTPLLVEVQAPSKVSEPGDLMWYSPHSPAEVGLTRPVTKILAELFP